jgi:hypothetical protein
MLGKHDLLLEKVCTKKVSLQKVLFTPLCKNKYPKLNFADFSSFYFLYTFLILLDSPSTLVHHHHG